MVSQELAQAEHRAVLRSKLSKREHEVFLALANGEKVTEIARRLGLSVKTVSTFRSRILAKMDLENNTHITLHALRCGLLAVE